MVRRRRCARELWKRCVLQARRGRRVDLSGRTSWFFSPLGPLGSGSATVIALRRARRWSSTTSREAAESAPRAIVEALRARGGRRRGGRRVETADGLGVGGLGTTSAASTSLLPLAGCCVDNVLWKMTDEDFFRHGLHRAPARTFTCVRAAAIRMREQGGRRADHPSRGLSDRAARHVRPDELRTPGPASSA